MPFDTLDVSPLIRALAEQPEDFALQGEKPSNANLLHPKSGHIFTVREGYEEVGIVAQCDCSHMMLSRESSQQVKGAVAAWDRDYWRGIVAAGGADIVLGKAIAGVTVGHHTFMRHQFCGAVCDGHQLVNEEFRLHFLPTPQQEARIAAQRAAFLQAALKASQAPVDAPVVVEATAWCGARDEQRRERASLYRWFRTPEPAMAGGDD